VGQDGHVAIESNMAGPLNNCRDTHDHPHLTTPHVEQQGPNHCGSCEDYAISQDIWHPIPDLDDQMRFSVQITTISAVDFGRDQTTAPFITRGPPLPDPPLSALRTVVLLS
jgi:hypothetical protein